MTIHLYTFGWNEMRMIGFFFRHYEPWVDKFIFFDDGSTDGTLELLASKKNVEIRPFAYASPDSFSLSVQAWRNSCWKESRGEADWVIVTDADEHLHHPALSSYLARCKDEGVTYIPALGFDMVTEFVPAASGSISPPAIRSVLQAPSTANSEFSIPSPSRRSITVSAHIPHRQAGALFFPRRMISCSCTTSISEPTMCQRAMPHLAPGSESGTSRMVGASTTSSMTGDMGSTSPI